MRTLVLCMQWCNGNIESTASTYLGQLLKGGYMLLITVYFGTQGSYGTQISAQDDRYLWDFAVH